jgi:tRNA-2-methylthio-N6-dimethylallyladenosine synthase
MADQIPREVQNARFDRLLALQNEISAEKNVPLVGTVQRVLSDGASKKDARVYNGRTAQNKLVFFEEPIAEGAWVNVHIDRAESFALYGTEVK